MADLQPLNSQDRLAFHLFYLLRHAPDLLAGVRPRKGFYDRAALRHPEADLARGIADAAPKAIGLLDDPATFRAVEGLHEEAVDLLYQPDPKAREGWLSFSWLRFQKMAKTLKALPISSLFGIQFVHHILV